MIDDDAQILDMVELVLKREGYIVHRAFSARDALETTETTDFYELTVGRHKKAATVFTSNREPAEWLTMTTDPMLAQSAVDRLTGAAHTLIIEGPSHRQRTNPGQRVGVDPAGR